MYCLDVECDEYQYSLALHTPSTIQIILITSERPMWSMCPSLFVGCKYRGNMWTLTWIFVWDVHISTQTWWYFLRASHFAKQYKCISCWWCIHRHNWSTTNFQLIDCETLLGITHQSTLGITNQSTWLASCNYNFLKTGTYQNVKNTVMIVMNKHLSAFTIYYLYIYI